MSPTLKVCLTVFCPTAIIAGFSINAGPTSREILKTSFVRQGGCLGLQIVPVIGPCRHADLSQNSAVLLLAATRTMPQGKSQNAASKPDRDLPVSSARANETANVAAKAPASCATMKSGTSAGAIPANVSDKASGEVTAGFANDVDAVNQYAAVM